METLYRLSRFITIGAFLALVFNTCSVVTLKNDLNGRAQYLGRTNQITGVYMIDDYCVNYWYSNRNFFTSNNRVVNFMLSPQRYLWKEGKKFSESPDSPRTIGWQLYYVGIPSVLLSLFIYLLFSALRDDEITIWGIIISMTWYIIATYNTFILFWWIYQWHNGNVLIETAQFWSKY